MFITHRTRSVSALLALGLLASLSATAWTEDAIRGSAQNLTRNQPAVGDEVALIRITIRTDPRLKGLAGSATPEEIESRTRTDAQGGFLLHARHPDNSYVVRLLHQGVPYEQPASAGDEVRLQVFDIASQVPAVAGSIEILRIGVHTTPTGKLLHVSDMYEVRNDSAPPRTQAGERTFGVFLPAHAKISSVLAAAPSAAESAAGGQWQSHQQGQGQTQERIGVMLSANPVPGEPGHYVVNFPLRPGATKFAFNYDLPYENSAEFHTRHEYGFRQMAVMVPATMKFSSASPAFQHLATNNEYDVEAVQVQAGDGPSFEISEGTTPTPPHAKSLAQPVSPDLLHSSAPAPPIPRASQSSASNSENPSRAPWSKVGFISAVFLMCALLAWHVRNVLPTHAARSRAPRPATAVDHPLNASLSFLERLKEDLFQLETDRIRGSISGEKYASSRRALDEAFEFAVSQQSKKKILK